MSLQVKYATHYSLLNIVVRFIIAAVAYNATLVIIVSMTLEEIKKNIDAVAKVLTESKNVDTSSIMLLSMAQTLILIAEEMVKKVEDGKNGKQILSKK